MPVGPDGWDGVLAVEEGDGLFELAAVAGQLERRQGVQGVPGLIYCGGPGLELRWRASAACSLRHLMA